MLYRFHSTYLRFQGLSTDRSASCLPSGLRCLPGSLQSNRKCSFVNIHMFRTILRYKTRQYDVIIRREIKSIGRGREMEEGIRGIEDEEGVRIADRSVR